MRILFYICLLFVLSGCVSVLDKSPTKKNFHLYGGMDIKNIHSGVVRILPSNPLCTGSLITDYLVLTDYNCLRGLSQQVMVTMRGRKGIFNWYGYVVYHTPQASVIRMVKKPPRYFYRYSFPSTPPSRDQVVNVVFFLRIGDRSYRWRTWDLVKSVEDGFLNLQNTKQVPCGSVVLNQHRQLIGMYSCTHHKFLDVYTSYQKFKDLNR